MIAYFSEYSNLPKIVLINPSAREDPLQNFDFILQFPNEFKYGKHSINIKAYNNKKREIGSTTFNFDYIKTARDSICVNPQYYIRRR